MENAMSGEQPADFVPEENFEEPEEGFEIHPEVVSLARTELLAHQPFLTGEKVLPKGKRGKCLAAPMATLLSLFWGKELLGDPALSAELEHEA